MIDETAVREIMSAPVLTTPGDATVREAAAVLAAERVGSLVVGADRIEGILTESDVVRAVGDGRDLGETTVGSVATDPVVTIRPGESLRAAGERMGHNAVKKLPVTVDGEPVGMVTTTDLAHAVPELRVRPATDTEPDVEEGEFE